MEALAVASTTLPVHKWQMNGITVHLPRSFVDDDEEEQETPRSYLGFSTPVTN